MFNIEDRMKEVFTYDRLKMDRFVFDDRLRGDEVIPECFGAKLRPRNDDAVLTAQTKNRFGDALCGDRLMMLTGLAAEDECFRYQRRTQLADALLNINSFLEANHVYFDRVT